VTRQLSMTPDINVITDRNVVWKHEQTVTARKVSP
jgi:hypothetical protein